MIKIDTLHVRFAAGGKNQWIPCDYMTAQINVKERFSLERPSDTHNGSDVLELYAELPMKPLHPEKYEDIEALEDFWCSADPVDELGNYDELLAEIIELAKENGIEYGEILVNGRDASFLSRKS